MERTQHQTTDTAISDAVFQADSGTAALGGGVLTVIWGMISRHRMRMWLAIILGCLSSLMHLIPAASAGLMIEALQQGERDIALGWGFAMMLGAILLVVFFGLSTSVSHLIAADVQAEQRHAIAQKLKTVPLGFFTRVSAIDLRKMLIDDIEKLEDGIAHLIPEITAAYFGPLMMLLTMLVLDWRLAIAAFLPTLLGFIVMSMMMQRSVEITNRFYRAQAGIASTLGEVIKLIPVVKTYNNGDAALSRATQAIHTFRDLVSEWIHKSAIPANWFFLLASANLVLLSPLSLYLWSQGQLSLGLLTFFHLAAMSLALLISSLFRVSTRLRQQEGLVARWQALMNQDSLPITEQAQQPRHHDIRFEDVSFAYADQTVLAGVNFSVPAGSSLALVGPSGSGKTTIARLLARFWDVDQGRITLGDVDLRDMRPETLSTHIAFVFQDIFLFSRSIADNIRLADPNANQESVIAAAKAARAHEFITALPQGYDTIIDGSLSLSTGQKQRISIARALLRNAPILVLDEATAFTDPENEYEVQQAISTLCRNKTVIVIAHRLSTIQNADQILFIQAGKIIEQGKHEQLLAQQGAYAAQWHTHIAARQFQFSTQGDA